MSDLDGMDAFTTVLDRMAEAEQRAEAKNNQLVEANSRLQKLQRGVDEIQATLSRLIIERNELQANNDKMNRVGTALWKAARDVINTPDNGEKLKVAMNAARDPFDDIPF